MQLPNDQKIAIATDGEKLRVRGMNYIPIESYMVDCDYLSADIPSHKLQPDCNYFSGFDVESLDLDKKIPNYLKSDINELIRLIRED